MTREEFDALFEILADQHKLPSKVREALRKACNSRWPEIAQLEDAQLNLKLEAAFETFHSGLLAHFKAPIDLEAIDRLIDPEGS